MDGTFNSNNSTAEGCIEFAYPKPRRRANAFHCEHELEHVLDVVELLKRKLYTLPNTTTHHTESL